MSHCVSKYIQNTHENVVVGMFTVFENHTKSLIQPLENLGSNSVIRQVNGHRTKIGEKSQN